MRRFAALLLAPLLLAPIRYQSGDETIQLNPSQGPSKNAVLLPSAAPLSSPTVITLSPTLLSATTPASVATPTVVAVPVKTDNLMPEATALICIAALKATSDLTVLSYQQQRQPAAIKLTVAANLAAGIASNRQYPNMTDLTEAFRDLRFNTPQKSELNTAVGAAQSACANPHPGSPTPGSRIPVPRPN